MYNNTPCVTSLDCDPYDTNRLCYFRNGSLFDPTEDPGEGVCRCNAYLGWTGAECDEISDAGFTSAVWMFTVASISAFVVLVMIYVICKTWSKAGTTASERITHARVNSSLLNLCFAASLCMWALLRGLASFSHGEEAVVVIRDMFGYEEYGYYSRYGDLQDFVFITLTGVFGLFSVINIAWIWIVTSENVNHISDAPKILLRFRIALYLVGIAGIATLIVVGILDRTSPEMRSTVGYIIPVHGLLLIILYIYGKVQFSKLLLSGEENCHDYMHESKVGFKVTRINVKWTTRAMIVGIVLQTTSWFAYSLMDNAYGIHTFTNDFAGTLVAPAIAEMMIITGTLIMTFSIGASLFNHTVPNAGADVRKSMRNLARVTTEAMPRMFGTNSSAGSNESDEKTRRIATRIAKEWSFELLEEKELMREKPEETRNKESEEKLDV